MFGSRLSDAVSPTRLIFIPVHHFPAVGDKILWISFEMTDLLRIHGREKISGKQILDLIVGFDPFLLVGKIITCHPLIRPGKRKNQIQSRAHSRTVAKQRKVFFIHIYYNTCQNERQDT